MSNSSDGWRRCPDREGIETKALRDVIMLVGDDALITKGLRHALPIVRTPLARWRLCPDHEGIETGPLAAGSRPVSVGDDALIEISRSPSSERCPTGWSRYRDDELPPACDCNRLRPVVSSNLGIDAAQVGARCRFGVAGSPEQFALVDAGAREALLPVEAQCTQHVQPVPEPVSIPLIAGHGASAWHRLFGRARGAGIRWYRPGKAHERSR